MLDAPDIGDEIPLSFALQISVYLASSILIEKQRATWNKVRIWSYHKVQGCSDLRVLIHLWNKTVAIFPILVYRSHCPTGCEHKAAARKISNSNDSMFLSNKLHIFVSKAAKKQYTLTKKEELRYNEDTCRNTGVCNLRIFLCFNVSRHYMGPIQKRKGEIKGRKR